MKEEKTIEKSSNRLEILKEIDRLEREGLFDVDPEKDPPKITLTPDKIDYLKTSSTDKLKGKVANQLGKKFLEKLLKDNKLIIKEVKGIENLEAFETTGGIITCNHFNPFDVFTIETIFRMTELSKKKKLYKVIREGNYTNFPGLYGFFFRHCDTLPLSSNAGTMMGFHKAVNTILQRGDMILIYPEQSLWWNYKKPKPLKDGAFKLAIQNNIPIVPIFITMEDSDIIGEDGFNVQEYIVNIEKPIFPDENLTKKENIEFMKNKNYNIWKKIYEDFYKIPLKYNTIETGVTSNEK